MKLKSLVCLGLIALLASVATLAHAQTYSVIYNFLSNDGGYPQAGVTIRGGSLYGTTYGLATNGVVYQLTRSGSHWENVDLSFFPTGRGPQARAVFGPDSRLYSTAGTSPDNQGLIFDLLPPSSICKVVNCPWTEKLVHQFLGADGSGPGFGDLIWDQQGNMYGTTIYGGQHGRGTVYEVVQGNPYTERVIYSFSGLSGPDGENPCDGVISDGKGNLFGTTARGGSYNAGTVFELTYSPSVGWTETVLYSFQDGTDGRYPIGGLVMDASGNLYGTTSNAGAQGAGTAFELSPSGNGWTFTLLHSFYGDVNGECGPQAPLTLDATGHLYGITLCSGSLERGSVFKLTNTGNGWTSTDLHDFGAQGDGVIPFGNVTIDTDGALYGTTSQGGSHQLGTVWMIKP